MPPLATEPRRRTLAHELVDSLGERIRDGRLAPGTKLGEIKPVFPRFIEPEAKAG